MSDTAERPTEVSDDYSARDAYQDYDVGAQYEKLRFSGAMGRYRRWAELRAVNMALEAVEPGSTILDCPCGIGRWWPTLAPKAGKLIAVDISDGMLAHARERAERSGLEVELVKADAESLPLADGSVDWVFSFALTKHLPMPVQYQVMREFGRVARRGVICTFGVFTHLTYEFWRRRKLYGSFPVLSEQLDAIAEEAGLVVEMKPHCTTPIGNERVVLMTKGRRPVP